MTTSSTRSDCLYLKHKCNYVMYVGKKSCNFLITKLSGNVSCAMLTFFVLGFFLGFLSLQGTKFYICVGVRPSTRLLTLTLFYSQ